MFYVETSEAQKSNFKVEGMHFSEDAEVRHPNLKRKESCTEGIGAIVASHYNQIEEKGMKARDQSRIVHMRNFNNWVKSVLILKYLNQIKEEQPDDHKIVAMDLGCGKGGDLFKWQKGGIRHLICADIAKTSVSQCQERYQALKNKERVFSAEFLVADCTKTLLFPKSRNNVDLVSCQFVFQYSFESLTQTETMIKNAAMCMKKHGYFLLTFPDANRIMANLESSGTHSFGNEVYKIEFPTDRPNPPPLFGDKYNFFLEGVVNCPEFLVHFPTLQRLCSKYDLELVYKKSFGDIFKDGMNEKDFKNLLFKMRCFEAYPPYGEGKNSSSNDTEYDHASKYLDSHEVNEVKTLSYSEWQAVCLYQAAVFKKMK